MLDHLKDNLCLIIYAGKEPVITKIFMNTNILAARYSQKLDDSAVVVTELSLSCRKIQGPLNNKILMEDFYDLAYLTHDFAV